MAKTGPKPRTAGNARRVAVSSDGWEPPAYLSKDAKAAWRHVVDLVASKGNLSRTDPTLIECYAVNVALLRQAREEMEKSSLFVDKGKGRLGAHPGFALINSATMRIKAIVNDLGLCPASAKHTAATGVITVEAAKQQDKWADILSVTG